MKIYKIRMITIPNFDQGGFEPNFRIKCKDRVVYEYKQEGKTKFLSQLSYYDFRIKSTNLLVYDDVKIEFVHHSKISQKKAFHFWFNTSFIDDTGILQLDKPMIDKCHKDKHCNIYDRSFRIEVYMSETEHY